MLGHITHEADEWKPELQNQKYEREAVFSNKEEFSDEGQESVRLTDNWKN